MCADHRSRVALAEIEGAFQQLRIPLRFPHGRPNIEPRDSIRITDPATVIRQPDDGGAPELLTMRWSWPGPSGKPVFNYRADGRAFGRGRCLIVADGFYEHTAPEAGAKRKTKWLFTDARAEHPWFAIAGLWRRDPEVGDAFTMLTLPPGPDIAPYHDRQIALPERAAWAGWLDGSAPAAEVLRPSAAGTLRVERCG